MGVIGFPYSDQDHDDGEVDHSRNQRGNPFGQAEEVVRLDLFEVEIHLF